MLILFQSSQSISFKNWIIDSHAQKEYIYYKWSFFAGIIINTPASSQKYTSVIIENADLMGTETQYQ